MPFKRKRRPYRRRRGISKSLRTYVQKTISANQETKQRDLSWDAIGIQDAGRTPLNAVINDLAQGDTQNTRDGNQVRITGFYGKFVVTGADSTNIVRFILYIPKDQSDSLSGIDIHSLIDQDSFTVLYDRTITTTSGGVNQKVFTVAKNFHRGSRKGLLTQFYGTGSQDFVKNPIRMYVVSDSLAVTDPSLTGHLRTYFKD